MVIISEGNRPTTRVSGVVGEPASETEKSSSPRRRFFRGAYHQVRLHALLGGFYERKASNLKTRTTADLTIVLHVSLILTTIQKP
jgi:hypothetical protein